jgi:hypothetical protein
MARSKIRYLRTFAPVYASVGSVSPAHRCSVRDHRCSTAWALRCLSFQRWARGGGRQGFAPHGRFPPLSSCFRRRSADVLASERRGSPGPLGPDALRSPPPDSTAGAAGPAIPNPPAVAEEAQQPTGPLHRAGESASQSSPGASIPAAQQSAPQLPTETPPAATQHGPPRGPPPTPVQQSAPQLPTETPPAAAQHGPPSGPPTIPAQQSAPQHPTETPPAATQHGPPTGPPTIPAQQSAPQHPTETPGPGQDELQSPPPDPPSLADAPGRVESGQHEELPMVAREAGNGPANVPSGTAAASPPDEPVPAQVTWDFGPDASQASGQSYGPVTTGPVSASHHDRGAWPPAGVQRSPPSPPAYTRSRGPERNQARWTGMPRRGHLPIRSQVDRVGRSQ